MSIPFSEMSAVTPESRIASTVSRKPSLPTVSSATPEDEGGVGFGEALGEMIENLDESQKAAEQKAQAYAAGEHQDIHGTMMALSRANITLRLAGTIRNRVLETYREVMRMSG